MMMISVWKCHLLLIIELINPNLTLWRQWMSVPNFVPVHRIVVVTSHTKSKMSPVALEEKSGDQEKRL